MATQPNSRPGSLWLILAAFAAVYLIWGSTYLAIKYVIETIPPFIAAGSRNLFAGLVLYLIARQRGDAAPTRLQWRDGVLAGILMITVGNGGVTWAEKSISSSIAALLVGLTPVWMVLFDWLRPRGTKPSGLVMLGLAVGFAGVALLALSPKDSPHSTYGWGVAAVLAASLCWAFGSIFNRTAHKPAGPFMPGATQLTTGGAILFVIATFAGEWNQFSFAQISLRSFVAWLYLMIAGSIIAYTAYVWLLQATSPARVSTYAYVNPFVAVLLGCTIGGEPLSREMMIAGALIIAAVVLVLRGTNSKIAAEKREMTRSPKTCTATE